MDHWLLPANVCFSVPFLISSLGRKMSFYDFGIGGAPVEPVLAKQRGAQVGVLLLNHYGLPWDEEDVSLIRKNSASVVLDACLSVPNFQPLPNSKADLTLYSSGKGKVVELGYGAFGHLITPLAGQRQGIVRQGFNPTGYDLLERYWKQVLEGIPFAKDIVLMHEWVDEGTDLLPDPIAYSERVKRQQLFVLRHKLEINRVYNELIDDEFHWHPRGNTWRFNIMVDDAELLLKEIFSRGLFASRHYANAARRLGETDRLPFADLVEKHMVNLFNCPKITAEFAERCAGAVQYLKGKGKLRPMRLSLP